MPRLVLVSDTHNMLGSVAIPDGDILVHAGDGTGSGRTREVNDWARDLLRLPHAHKVVIAGNHDWLFQRLPEAAREAMAGITYLEDEGAVVMGLRIWGSPWQPAFADWAFNLPRGPRLAEKWSRIPAGLDVLITHGPPHGVLDLNSTGEHTGCADLRQAVLDKAPRIHVFGHIHEGYGEAVLGTTRCFNASTCNAHYKPVNAPIVVDLEPSPG